MTMMVYCFFNLFSTFFIKQYDWNTIEIAINFDPLICPLNLLNKTKNMEKHCMFFNIKRESNVFLVLYVVLKKTTAFK